MESKTNYESCKDALKKVNSSGSDWGFCPPETCYNISNYSVEWCRCLGPFSVPPYVQNGVCQNSVDTLIPVPESECFCCCCCVGAGWRIMTSQSEAKPVNEITTNDVVLTATDKSLKNWVQTPVKFSAGTGQGTNKQIKVYYGDPTKGLLLNPISFSSKTISQELSSEIFQTLSTAPNDYIDTNGFVKLDVVHNSRPLVLEELLRLPQEDTTAIYDMLSHDPNYLLVTSDQVFLLSDKTLKKASRLLPGKDSLVRADGTPAPVYALAVSLFDLEIHQISTTEGPATSEDRHLIIVNEIVMADYALQLKIGFDETRNQPIPLKTDFELKGITTEPSATPGRTIIRLQFNQAVDDVSAQFPGYYMLTPESQSYSSGIDKNDNTVVLLESALKTQVYYSLTISDLRSSDIGKQLVTGKNSAKFKL